jgi:hypothetical protein
MTPDQVPFTFKELEYLEKVVEAHAMSSCSEIGDLKMCENLSSTIRKMKVLRATLELS